MMKPVKIGLYPNNDYRMLSCRKCGYILDVAWLENLNRYDEINGENYCRCCGTKIDWSIDSSTD